ncbi:MAG: ATP-binding protein [Dissulfuribacterales bacterium]
MPVQSNPPDISDYNEENENQKLKERPSISIRMTIAISYALFFILCFAITIWSFWIISALEDKIKFLEITDNYLVEIQQARRFEKNYLLYGTNLEDALEHLANAKKILATNTKTIKKIMGEKIFQTKSDYMLKYHNQLSRLKASVEAGNRDEIVPLLRQYGGKIVSSAEEFVKKERSSVSHMLKLAKRVPFYFISGLLILMMIFIIFFTQNLMVTLNRFMDYTKRIGEGDFSPIVPAKKFKNEFTKLAEAFNTMIRELNHKHSILLESHKLRAIGTLVAGVAHELNNPLNNTLLTAEMLKEDLTVLSDTEKIEMIDDMINETERSQIIVKGLLDFARESETDIKPLKIEEIMSEAIRLVANQVKMAMVKLETDFDDNLPGIYGDEQLLKQVFVNLIINALDVLPPGGKVRVDIHKNKNSDFVVMEVEDNGPGIPEHIQSRIFEPFFTTKGQGKGTGLGLSVSKGIIRKLGGYIHLKRSSESGTVIMVSLPAVESPSEMMSKK